MTLKHRDKVCITSSEDVEIDIKRLRFRLGVDSDAKAIKSAVHMLATMNIADFYQFVQAYKDRVVYDNPPQELQKKKTSKIQRAGGVEILIVYKILGYTLKQTAEELNCRPEEVNRWLKRRGLSWKNLK